jgi:alginate biosynthesis protein Alg44
MNQEFIRLEGDVLRRHASYKLPLTCVIDGQRYQVSEWSVAGVVLRDASSSLELNKLYDITLVFPFDGYDFALELQALAELIDGRWGLHYANPTPSQITLFRYILDSYLTGELVTAGEILDIRRRDEAGSGSTAKRTSSKAQPTLWQQTAGWLGRAAWLLIIAAIIVGLASYVTGSVAQRMSLISTESAMVTVDTVPAFAMEAGVVTNLASGSVKLGQPLATIMTASRNSTTVFSPCDCVVTDTFVAIGASVGAGQRLALLQDVTAQPYVLAWIDRDHVLDLYRGATAQVELASGQSLRGLALKELPLVSQDKVKKGDLVPVKVALPEDATGLVSGEPVVVRFLRANDVSAQGIVAGLGAVATGTVQGVKSLFGIE